MAWGQSVTQHQGTSEISPGYEALAQVLSSAVELLAANRDVDPEDLELGRATAEKALEEVVKPAPDRSALRSLLATLRGLVTVGANAAASEGARTLVASLVLP